jgi:hypothetical protein
MTIHHDPNSFCHGLFPSIKAEFFREDDKGHENTNKNQHKYDEVFHFSHDEALLGFKVRVPDSGGLSNLSQFRTDDLSA